VRRRGFCIYGGFCSRKNGETMVVEGKIFPKCHLAGLIDCRYLIITTNLKPSEREIIRLLR